MKPWLDDDGNWCYEDVYGNDADISSLRYTDDTPNDDPYDAFDDDQQYARILAEEASNNEPE